MKSKIKLYRVILNVLFFIFYVLLVSISFSFIFPSIMVLLGKQPLNPTDPIFDNIQIGIVILVVVLSIIFRKYFYLPTKEDKVEQVVIKKQTKNIKKEKNNNSKKTELDIKIGKEIK